MKRIRKGKTILVKWKVRTNGKDISLSGRDLTLELMMPSGSARQLDFTIEGGVAPKAQGAEGTMTDGGDTVPVDNIIVAKIEGTSNTALGAYRFVLWENKDKDDQTVVDTDGYEIVNRTADEN